MSELFKNKSIIEAADDLAKVLKLRPDIKIDDIQGFTNSIVSTLNKQVDTKMRRTITLSLNKKIATMENKAKEDIFKVMTTGKTPTYLNESTMSTFALKSRLKSIPNEASTTRITDWLENNYNGNWYKYKANLMRTRVSENTKGQPYVNPSDRRTLGAQPREYRVNDNSLELARKDAKLRMMPNDFRDSDSTSNFLQNSLETRMEVDKKVKRTRITSQKFGAPSSTAKAVEAIRNGKSPGSGGGGKRAIYRRYNMPYALTGTLAGQLTQAIKVNTSQAKKASNKNNLYSYASQLSLSPSKMTKETQLAFYTAKPAYQNIVVNGTRDVLVEYLMLTLQKEFE